MLMIFFQLLKWTLILMMVPYLEAGFTNIEINIDQIIETISEKFLSVTIDTEQIQVNWATLNLT